MFEQARFQMYISDNFSSVKNCFSINNTAGLSRVDVFSGFFVIEGKILDPFTEAKTFESLKINQDSEIILVCWNKTMQDESDDEDLWGQIYF